MAADPLANAAVGLHHRYGAHRKVAVHAVGTPHPVLEDEQLPVRHRVVPADDGWLAVVGMEGTRPAEPTVLLR